MKRAPEPRPAVDRDLRDRARLGQRDRLPDRAGSGVAALAGQPRLHRPQPLVRALRRRRPARLPALRPRSGRPARRSTRCARRALVVRDALDGARTARRTRRRPDRRACTSTCRSCADRRRRRCGAFAKRFAFALATLHPALITAEYRIAKRPAGRVLVDYNQNAWGRTLASVYSPRPRPRATVSTPVTWEEIEDGMRDRGLPHRQRADADRRGGRPVGAGARAHGARSTSSRCL